jgi:hypothetical protein
VPAPAGSAKKWKASIRVEAGGAPDMPAGGGSMTIGKWLDQRGIDIKGKPGHPGGAWLLGRAPAPGRLGPRHCSGGIGEGSCCGAGWAGLGHGTALVGRVGWGGEELLWRPLRAPGGCPAADTHAAGLRLQPPMAAHRRLPQASTARAAP